MKWIITVSLLVWVSVCICGAASAQVDFLVKDVENCHLGDPCPSDQEESNWCWAAIIQCIGKLEDDAEITQCFIQDISNTLAGIKFCDENGENCRGTDCCGDDNCWHTFCNQTNVLAGENGSVADCLNSLYTITTLLDGSLTCDSIYACLNAGRPFIAAVCIPVAHFMFVIGYSEDEWGMDFQYYVMDPAKYAVQQYSDYYLSTERVWCATLKINKKYPKEYKNNPVALVEYFHPILKDGRVEIGWKTKWEIDSRLFRVEKKREDGSGYSPIALARAKGDADHGAEYRCVDPAGTLDDIYRIIEIEQSGFYGVLTNSSVFDRDPAEIVEMPVLWADPRVTRQKTLSLIEHLDYMKDERGMLLNTIYDWLVIYPDSFSSYVDDLMTWRSQDHTPYGISVEAIGDPPWDMTVQQFIQNIWTVQGHSLRYVLIVGNGVEIIPIDKFYDGPGNVLTRRNIYESDILLGDVDDDGLAEVAVGRIPARNTEELINYINKLITYESTPVGEWADTLSFFTYAVEENHCSGELADSLATELAACIPGNRIVHYNMVNDDNIGELGPAERKALFAGELNAGKSLVFGFGTVSKVNYFVRWNCAMADLSANHPLPFMLGASCEIADIFNGLYGRHYLRDMLFDPSRGVIAAFAPSGWTWQAANYEVSKWALRYLYDWGAPSVGYACMHSQRVVMEGSDMLDSSARSYVFLGDPALKLAGCEVCNTDFSISVVMDPNVDLYEFGDNVTIEWTCTGCPWKIHVELVEDLSTKQMLATFDQYDTPELASGSVPWTVTGISQDYENHYYRIKFRIWDLANNYEYEYSRTFDIVEYIPQGKPDPRPIVQFAGDDGHDIEHPLPVLSAVDERGFFQGESILPTNPLQANGVVNIEICGCKGHKMRFDIVDLYTVDVSDGYSVWESGQELFVSHDSRDCSLIFLEGAANPQGVLQVQKSRAVIESPAIELGEDSRSAFSFEPEAKPEKAKRYYVLAYGGSVVETASRTDDIPRAFGLINPFPNPFNPSTTIEFHVPEHSKISLDIFDSSGKFIESLLCETVEPGIHRVVWNGRNMRGAQVSSGIYFCRLNINNSKSIAKKLILLR